MYFIKNLVVFLSLLLVSLPAQAREPRDCVIVLHGMGRTERSMSKIEDRLQEAGYLVWNHHYESTSGTIASLSESAIGDGLRFCALKQVEKVHFVTHSLGGILVRHYLQDKEIDNLGRIVMLAPPNRGSEVVDTLREYRLYGVAMGPAGMALGTGSDSLPNQLKPISGEIGVIAGNSTSDPWFSPIIPGEDDGKVSVERAKLEEMKDFLVVDSGHTFIMRDDEVIDQILYFLQEGKFNPQLLSRDSLDYGGR
jgi:pimeloyl-ACP methyl ester carboxylesterase